jgi:hypothetical protein
MLSNALKGTWHKLYRDTIDALGVPATVYPKSGDAVECIVGFKTSSDVDVINSWGVGSKIVTVQVADVAHLEKLDRVQIGTERYTLDSVAPVHLNDVLVGWRGIVRGS